MYRIISFLNINKNDILQKHINSFYCPLNNDSEKFLKQYALSASKHSSAITHLIFENSRQELLGYFTLALKILALNKGSLTKSKLKKLSNILSVEGKPDTEYVAAYLIAQLAKNFNKDNLNQISGFDKLLTAESYILNIQKQIGGRIIFIESVDNKKVVNFYEDNGYIELREITTNNEKLHLMYKII